MSITLAPGARRVLDNLRSLPNPRTDPPWARSLVRSIHRALGTKLRLEGREARIAKAAQAIDSYRPMMKSDRLQEWAYDVVWTVCDVVYGRSHAVAPDKVKRLVDTDFLPWLRDVEDDLRAGRPLAEPNFAPARLIQDAEPRRRPARMQSTPKSAIPTDTVVGARVKRPILRLPGSDA